MSTKMTKTFYRLKEVLQIFSVSKSTLYLWIAEGTFPKQVKLGKRASAWLASDIQAHLDKLVTQNQNN